MAFTINVQQVASSDTLADLKAGDFALITNSDSNPSDTRGHLIYFNGTNYPDLSDVTKSFTSADNLAIDVLEPGAIITLNITSAPAQTQTWAVPIPQGMTQADAMGWVGQFVTVPGIDIQVSPNADGTLHVTAPIGAFNCPGATLIAIG